MPLLSDLLNIARGNAGQKLGGAVGVIGNTLGLEEGNWSERIADLFAPKAYASGSNPGLENWDWENPWDNKKEGRNLIAEQGLLDPLSGGNRGTTRGTTTGDILEEESKGKTESAEDKLRKWVDEQISKLRGVRDEGRAYLRDARSTLDRRRGEFQQEYDDIATDIFNQYQGGRGDLQKAARGADARTTRGLLARGVAGSALDEALRMNQAARMGALNSVIQNRASNDRENARALAARQGWADDQEAAIRRNEETLNRLYSEGVNTSLSNAENTLGSLLEQAQAQRAALQAIAGNVADTVLPGAQVAGLDTRGILNALNSAQATSGLMGMAGATNPNANINIDTNLSRLAEERKRRGLLQAPVYNT